MFKYFSNVNTKSFLIEVLNISDILLGQFSELLELLELYSTELELELYSIDELELLELELYSIEELDELELLELEPYSIEELDELELLELELESIELLELLLLLELEYIILSTKSTEHPFSSRKPSGISSGLYGLGKTSVFIFKFFIFVDRVP